MRFLMIAMFLISGCTTYRTANNLMLVSMVDTPTPGKSVGPVLAKDCATRVFGIGASATGVTIDKALQNGRTKSNFRYLNNFSIDTSETHIIVYERNCIDVRGQGYQ